MAIGAKGKSSRIFVWIILILLIVGLAGFGATSFNGQLRYVGKVGDTEISVSRYSRELDQELRALSAQVGQTLTLSQARQFGVDTAVLQRLVAAAALENETKQIGLSVGDEEVRRQLLASTAFAGIDGQFDREAYEFTLQRAGLSPAEFEDTVRADTAGAVLEGAISGGVKAPAVYGDIILDFIGERRNFSWIELDAASLEAPIPASTVTDILAYYDANTDAFMLPEARNLTYVWLSPDAITSQIEVDEDALLQLYKDRANEYNQPERRLVERLIFGSEQEADAAIAAITAGTSTFEDVVTARGLSLADIDLGDVTRTVLGFAGEDVFALTSPGIVGPLNTDLGPALFRVNAILSASETPFEDVREALQEEYAADAARRLIGDQITEFDDLLAGGATLEDLADETDMVLGQIDWTAETTDDIAAYEAFAAAASQVTADDFPEIVALDDGGVFALRLNEIVAAHPEAFETAKNQVEAAWLNAETLARLTTIAETLTTAIDGGETISSQGHPVTVETHITRSSFIEDTPAEFLADVFKLESGKSLLFANGDKVLVAQLLKVLPPDAEDPDSEVLKTTITNDSSQSTAQDLLMSFTRAVETDAGIVLNQEALNAVHAQFP
ncbi:MAG: peptidylprolyl isomerase [Paracoccaceae bacterium]